MLQKIIELLHFSLQETIQQFMGDAIAQQLKSFEIDTYPLLICFSFNIGHYEITRIVQGVMNKEETIKFLEDARLQFDRRIEEPCR